MTTTLIATSPAAMESAQKDLIAWCETKKREVQEEIRELRENLDIAQRNKWRTKTFESQIKRVGQRFAFYDKIVKALEAGFYVVPNFHMTAFAVRTDRPKRVGKKKIGWMGRQMQPAKMLPAGEGDYKPAEATIYKCSETFVKKGETKTRERTYCWPEWGDEIPFPLALAQPGPMSATEKAMAARVFDAIGVSHDYTHASCGDPMILGRLLNPRRGGSAVTFFIAWVLPLDRI